MNLKSEHALPTPQSRGTDRIKSMPQTIEVIDLPEPLVMAIKSMVSTYREKTWQDGAAEERPLDWLKERWTVPDSFFEPLPKDVLVGFNGGLERE